MAKEKSMTRKFRSFFFMAMFGFALAFLVGCSSSDSTDGDTNPDNGNGTPAEGTDAAVAIDVAEAESEMNEYVLEIGNLTSDFLTEMDENTELSTFEADLEYFDNLSTAAGNYATHYPDWLDNIQTLSEKVPVNPTASQVGGSKAHLDDSPYAITDSPTRPNVNTEDPPLLWDRIAGWFDGWGSNVVAGSSTLSLGNINNFQNEALAERDAFNSRWESVADTNEDGRVTSEEFARFREQNHSEYFGDKLETAGRVAGGGGFTIARTVFTGAIGIGAGIFALSTGGLGLPLLGAIAFGAGAGVAGDEVYDYMFTPSATVSGNMRPNVFPSDSTDIYFVQGTGTLNSATSFPEGTYDGMIFVKGKGPIFIHSLPITAGSTFTVTDLRFVDEDDFTINDIFGWDMSETDDASASFSATIGLSNNTSVTFSPNYVHGVLTEYSGRVELTNLPVITATEASSALEMAQSDFDTIAITTNPNIITGPGTYTLSDTFFALEEDGVHVFFYTPQVTNYTGDAVVFSSYGGSITFTSYGNSIGDTVAGTYSINIDGTQTTGQEWDEDAQEYEDVDVEITGTISGSFNVTIAENP